MQHSNTSTDINFMLAKTLVLNPFENRIEVRLKPGQYIKQLFYQFIVHQEKYLILIIGARVESGSDDPDNLYHLGHFFDGSSGSHKLDVTQIFNRSHVLKKTVLASGKRVKLCLVIALNHCWCETSNCFEACGVQRFYSQKVCVWV